MPDLANLGDRAALLSALADHPPIFWSSTLQSWIVSKYEDVQSMLFDPQFIRTAPSCVASRETEGASDWLVFSAGDRHRLLRRSFGELLIRAQHLLPRSKMETVAREIVVKRIASKPANFFSGIAAAFSWKLVQVLFGSTDDELLEMQSLCRVIDVLFSGHPPKLAEVQAASLAIQKLETTASRGLPFFLDGAYQSLITGADVHKRSVSALAVFIYGLHETFARLLANAVYCLLLNPTSLKLVSPNTNGSSLGLIHEVLRYLGPTTAVPRTSTVTKKFCGVTVRNGDQVMLVVAAANRDDDVFDRPNIFDPLRTNAHQHLSFGSGLHACQAASLSLRAASAFLSVMKENWHRLEFQFADVSFRPAINSYGVEGLWVARLGRI